MEGRLRVRLVITVLAVMTAAAAAGFAYEQRLATRTNGDLDAARQQLGQAQTNLAQLKSRLADANATTAGTSLPEVPAMADEPGLMDELNACAAAAHVHIENVTLSDSATAPAGVAAAGGQRPSGSSTAVSVSLTVTGARDQVIDFIDRLQTGPRLCQIGAIQVTGSDASHFAVNLNLEFPYVKG
ncbi:MAG: hypothetical protein K6T81_15370 [Alicyclobacillus macrosporangiidus]|uniref:hypothetical protein n=1 Tax=Alicyclobacillus macrosporangiidus TaxID=392015 RepID=UPI0026F0D222|nr:hypothetical protein [Alicyclobacillus macrosporangiidus]MCL6600097.1 hypothetical protein [Alicyclobacillus macrosporangiidus]